MFETMEVINGRVHWNPIVARPIQDWANFFELLYSARINMGMKDKVFWELKKKMIALVFIKRD